MNIEIANRLVQLRKQHGLSQEELAARLGISRQAVSKWERAEASPDTDNLILLSRVYNVSIDELLRTEDEIPEPQPEKGVKITFNGKPVRFEAGNGFRFSVGDGEDEEALPRGEGKGVAGHIEISRGDEEASEEAEDGAETDGKPFYKWFPYPMLMSILYLCMGFGWGLWHPGWIVFLTIPVYYSIAGWIEGSRKHSFWRAFPYPVFVSIVFLLLGCVWGLWHPAWMLYLTIPIYYPIAHAADRHYRARQNNTQ